jgi:N-acetylneuraminic acid mutarotase
VVTLAVSGGMYSVLLGNAAIPQMTVVPPTAFNHPDVRLRVWFSDGMSGFQLMTPDQRIAAVGYAMMATNAQTAVTAGTATTVVDGAITGAKIAAGAVGSSQLAPGAVSASLVAAGQSVVPSGGMILSRMASDPNLIGAGYAAMGNQFMLDASWAQRQSAPIAGRAYASAVWTGAEMIVWGGFNFGMNSYRRDGARYSPVTSAWTGMSSEGAPLGGGGASVAWSGTELIVWGGTNNPTGNLGDGARYNPLTNAWSAMSSVGAPLARAGASAVWSGTELIVWGGATPNFLNLGDGARYNPVTNAWSVMSSVGAPSARREASAVWNGTELIIWGGVGDSGSLGDGASYNPLTNAWTVMSSLGAPWVRYGASAVWSGAELIVWSGSENRPDTYTWSPSRIFYLYNRP